MPVNSSTGYRFSRGNGNTALLLFPRASVQFTRNLSKSNLREWLASCWSSDHRARACVCVYVCVCAVFRLRLYVIGMACVVSFHEVLCVIVPPRNLLCLFACWRDRAMRRRVRYRLRGRSACIRFPAARPVLPGRVLGPLFRQWRV